MHGITRQQEFPAIAIASDEIRWLSYRGASYQELRQNWIEKDVRNRGPHFSIPTGSTFVPLTSDDVVGILRKASDALGELSSRASKLPRSDDRSTEGIATPSVPDDLPSFTSLRPHLPPASSDPASPAPGSVPTDFQGYQPNAQFEEIN